MVGEEVDACFSLFGFCFFCFVPFSFVFLCFGFFVGLFLRLASFRLDDVVTLDADGSTVKSWRVKPSRDLNGEVGSIFLEKDLPDVVGLW